MLGRGADDERKADESGAAGDSVTSRPQGVAEPRTRGTQNASLLLARITVCKKKSPAGKDELSVRQRGQTGNRNNGNEHSN